ncbi:argininosuccinate synthase [Mycobacterium frederiksbergense]|uniref:argininosuccinate synthase n=1 Tax=Mycolicibacterium frederiksbergense TaxID=117567 RepID=A0ABT6KTP7_9MYCO|nr:argininosuccinate synthase-related protein [Mycolicibacterium frederiksbergense]MDH6194052.1 argininosuccinate synthase [Mycolicibacterium frederiksbergense]
MCPEPTASRKQGKFTRGQTTLTANQQVIRSFDQMFEHVDRAAPVLTLFSGGLDSSYLLLRLKKAGFTDIHALSVNIGELETVEEKHRIAALLGVKLHLSDRRHEFADDFVAPAIKAHAVYLGLHPVSSTLSRPLIARAATEVGDALGCAGILHTANRSQNTLRRLNGALRLLGFSGFFGSPYDLQPVSRQDKLAALAAAGVTFADDRAVSGDSNLWCREFESGALDDPEHHDIPESIYRWTAPTDAAQDFVSVTFEEGTPTAVDGHRMELVALIGHLNDRVGRLGIGRYTGLEHLDNGEKVLEVREAPAAWLLLATARHIESACLPAELIATKMTVEQIWTREALEGRWFGGLKAAAEAFIDTCAREVTGTVKWRLRPGSASTSAILAEHPLYLRDREQWETESIHREYTVFAPVLAGMGATR